MKSVHPRSWGIAPVSIGALCLAGFAAFVTFAPGPTLKPDPTSATLEGATEASLLADVPSPFEAERKTGAIDIDAETQRSSTSIQSSHDYWIGTASVATEDGRTLKNLDGTLVLVCADASTEYRASVSVDQGRWQCEVLKGSQLLGADLVLADRRVQLEPSWHAGIDLSSTISIHGTWGGKTWLTVVDDSSAAPLRQVIVRDGSAEPGPRGVRVAGERVGGADLMAGDSPVDLSSLEEARELCVGAPGFAWKSVTIDPTGGGERYLTLEPLEQVTIVLDDMPINPGPLYLRVYPAEVARAKSDQWPGLSASDAYIELSVRDRHRIVVDLPRREWGFRIETHNSKRSAASSPLVLASLSDASEHVVRLRYVPRLVRAQGCQLQVTFQIARDRVPEQGAVLLRRAEPALLGEPATFRMAASDWKLVENGEFVTATCVFEPMASGPVRLCVLPWQVSAELVLDKPGVTTIEVEVPTTKRVAFQVLDANSGEPVGIRRAVWGRMVDGGEGRWEPTVVMPDVEARQVAMDLPLEAVVVTLTLPGRRHVRKQIDVRSTPDLVQWSDQPSPGVEVCLRDNGVQAIIDDKLWEAMELRSLAGIPVEVMRTISASGASSNVVSQQLLVLKPGEYVLRLPLFPGFERVPDVPVSLRAGEVLPTVIELVRRRTR